MQTETNTQMVTTYDQEISTLPHPATSTSALVLDGDSLDKMMRLADIMATGRATMPKHFNNSPADCLAVVMQAMQWKMNPFAVAQKTHVVNGTLGYEAQLVNAVIQTSGSITGRFHYEYQGDGNSLACRVGAVIRGEEEITWNEWLKSSDVTTKNSPLWKTNPKQQLGYLQIKNWSRLYCPGVILGVYTPDELADSPRVERDITPRSRPADIAGAARLPAERTETHDRLIADLERLAKDEGESALAVAWQNLSKDDRKAIGPEELARLKDIALDSDLARQAAAEASEVQADD